MNRPFLRILFFTLLLALTGPLLHAQRELLTPDQIDYVNKTWPHTRKTSTGMRYLVEKEGTGAMPKPGDEVSVLYVGKLLSGEKFDEQLDPAHPLVFRVARGNVIEGWDQIIQSMKKGEKRLVIIPSSLAYGSRGRAPNIPRDAVLVFDMELIGIKPE
jgi:FKBP-type peptidyl-prolyl cis-trans isomerase